MARSLRRARFCFAEVRVARPPPSRREDAAIHLPHSSSGGGNSPSSRAVKRGLPPSVRSTGGGGSLGGSQARRRGWFGCFAEQRRLFPWIGCRSSLGADLSAWAVWHSRLHGGGSSSALRRRGARASQRHAAQLSARAEEAAGLPAQFARVCVVSWARE